MSRKVPTTVAVDEIKVDLTNRRWDKHPPHVFMDIDIGDIRDDRDTLFTVTVRRKDGTQARAHLSLSTDGVNVQATFNPQRKDDDNPVTRKLSFFDYTTRGSERWIFSRTELANSEPPNGFDRDAEFTAISSELPECGVIVNRQGKATNRYGDGTRGVTKAHKRIAEAEEALYQDGALCDDWRDVEVDDNGRLVRFL